MLLYSIAGACLILACGAEASRRLNNAASKKVRAADNYLSLLRYVKSQVDCYAMPINEILKRADPALLEGCGWRGEDPPRTLSELVSNAPVGERAIEGILLEFSEDFGNSYLYDQIRRCDHFIALLEERRDSLARELPSKRKLNSTLCISGALALIILLI